MLSRKIISSGKGPAEAKKLTARKFFRNGSYSKAYEKYFDDLWRQFCEFGHFYRYFSFTKFNFIKREGARPEVTYSLEELRSELGKKFTALFDTDEEIKLALNLILMEIYPQYNHDQYDGAKGFHFDIDTLYDLITWPRAAKAFKKEVLSFIQRPSALFDVIKSEKKFAARHNMRYLYDYYDD